MLGYGSIEPLFSADSGRVTGVAVDVGDEIDEGQEILRTNGRPMVSVTGETPFWRELTEGATGADVVQLEEILSAAGYAAGESGTFDSTTAGSLREWQAEHDFPDLDGTLQLNDVLVAQWPMRVATIAVQGGAFVQPGSSLLEVSSLSPVVRAELVPSDRIRVELDDRVVLDASGADLSLSGTIAALGDFAVTREDGSLVYHADIAVDVSNNVPEGVELRVTVVVNRVEDVLTVPLASVVSGDGGQAAVRVVNEAGSTLVDIELGVTSGAWVEVRSGLDGDEIVVVAGS